MRNDSVQKTLIVAASLCIVCSVLVSGAAVSLRPMQEFNERIDVKKNLLLAAGLVESASVPAKEIQKIYEKKIEAKVIDLSTGEVVQDMSAESYDPRTAVNKPEMSVRIPGEKDRAGIKKRAVYSEVYLVKKEGKIDMLVLPVYGKGLWSTMYGFLALDRDARTVRGIGFYEHGETPGLGGEIENPRWQKQWVGKKVFDENFDPAFQVVKGSVGPDTPESEHKVDGLSGATITSNGVTGMIRYWMGHHGFGKYLKEFREGHDLEATQATSK